MPLTRVCTPSAQLQSLQRFFYAQSCKDVHFFSEKEKEMCIWSMEFSKWILVLECVSFRYFAWANIFWRIYGSDKLFLVGWTCHCLLVKLFWVQFWDLDYVLLACWVCLSIVMGSIKMLRMTWFWLQMGTMGRASLTRGRICSWESCTWGRGTSCLTRVIWEAEP